MPRPPAQAAAGSEAGVRLRSCLRQIVAPQWGSERCLELALLGPGGLGILFPATMSLRPCLLELVEPTAGQAPVQNRVSPVSGEAPSGLADSLSL